MNISKFTKKNKNIVIEIDEVEYLINDAALVEIEGEKESIRLIRLIDRKYFQIGRDKIIKSLNTIGPVDYLDK